MRNRNWKLALLFLTLSLDAFAFTPKDCNGDRELATNPGFAPVKNVVRVRLPKKLAQFDIPIGRWFRIDTALDVSTYEAQQIQLINLLAEKGYEVVIRTLDDSLSSRFFGKIIETNVSIGRGGLKFRMPAGRSIRGDSFNPNRKLNETEAAFSRSDIMNTSGPWEIEYSEVTGVFILPPKFAVGKKTNIVLKNSETVSDTTNKLSRADIVVNPNDNSTIQVKNLEFEGWDAVLPGTIYATPAMRSAKQDQLLLTMIGKYVSPSSGTKIVEYRGVLRDGRFFYVDLMCYATAPGNTMGVNFHITWPELNETRKLFAHATFDQNGGDCRWGVWGEF
jgi:hypothetical protein